MTGRKPESGGERNAEFIASGPVPRNSDDQLSARIGAALDEITAEAISAVRDLLVASSVAGPDPGAVRGIGALRQISSTGKPQYRLMPSDAVAGSRRHGHGAS